jgi:hypothetical protein
MPVRAVYGPAWRSGIRLRTVVYPMTWVLVRSWLWRLRHQGRIEVSPSSSAPEAECASAS